MHAQNQYDVAVIGAGQAGLTMGYELARKGRRFIILEAADSVGAAWRARWDSLTLFTPRRYDGLPGLDFPGDPDGYPGRDEVIAYLESYAKTFELPVQLGSPVRSVRSQSEGFVLELDEGAVEAGQVVVATGPFQVPRIPGFAADLDPTVFQTHSVGYRNPGELPAGPVVVVGGGNTGFQIAQELAATRETHLAVGSRQTPLPQRLAGRDLFWWLGKLGILEKSVDTKLGRRLSTRETLIGSSPRTAKRAGVTMHTRAVGASGRTVVFEDGSTVDVAAVIWATGYRFDHSWIDLPITEGGRLVHRRGVTDAPGLYFLGLPWQHTRGSALVGWVKDDAQFIAERIAERASTTAQHSKEQQPMANDNFPTGTAGLAPSVETPVVELSDGEELDLTIAPVTKEIGDDTVRMLAYNGSIPGPTLKVKQGSELVVNVRNEGDLEATVHWHGLRLDNRYDGTHETQAPMPVGGSFTYRIEFPDPGVYWYHPHIREDYGQEMGLYGNILVEPAESDYWPPAHRDVVLTLDDILIEDGHVAGFSRAETTHVAMGRFGETMLVGGETELSLDARRGEVVRFFLTNTANTRVFRVGVAGATMKLVGGDSGRVEREEIVEDVILAPSERVVVDVLFETAGEAALEHRTPEQTYRLATIAVTEDEAEALDFHALRENADLAAERERIAPYLEAEPDRTLSLVAEMNMPSAEGETSVFACPMHAEIVASWAGKCPKCGMKLMPAGPDVAAPTEYACPMHPEITATWAGECPKCGMTLRPTGGGHDEHEHHGHHDHEEHAHHHGHGHDATAGIEWEDDMVEVNRKTTPANTQWLLIDKDTGDRGHAIDWRFHVGDQVKLRLVNEMDSDHPMHHPFHIHGAGRFLVLARDGVAESNLVWKDTVLVRTGETVDVLLDVTNPGRWMAHCHIAEHHESGMMFSFTVEP